MLYTAVIGICFEVWCLRVSLDWCWLIIIENSQKGLYNYRSESFCCSICCSQWPSIRTGTTWHQDRATKRYACGTFRTASPCACWRDTEGRFWPWLSLPTVSSWPLLVSLSGRSVDTVGHLLSTTNHHLSGDRVGKRVAVLAEALSCNGVTAYIYSEWN